MTEILYTVTDELGIHARPAGMLVKLLQGFQSNISISCKGKQADGKKLFALMSMGVKRGDTLLLTANGPDDADAAQAAERFFIESL